ncbi:low temperature requirement protein A [Streptomyces sp. NPDC047071]|uniref:low temperature requirement protein A n=1 Tax=Streptomyces sp. NPDC047071 TaxID=3154808 RepID=UPI003451DE36
MRSALDGSAALDELPPIAVGGLLIVFAAFWIYFAVPIHEYLATHQHPFLWAYSHNVIFGSAAAIGAGIEVAVEQATHHAHISALPTALFMITTWAGHARHFKRGTAQHAVLPVGAVLVLAGSLAGHWAVPLAGPALTCTVATGVRLAAPQP